MDKAVKLLARSFINLIYPPRCANCGKDIDPAGDPYLCNLCAYDIKRNPRPHCMTCGRPTARRGCSCGECRKRKFHFTRAYSAYVYDGAFKELVHLFKYRSRLSLSEKLANLMIEFMEEDPGILKDVDVMTFVPLDNRRLARRGFNQSKILALKISERFEIPLVDTLEKTKRTRRQNELSRDERLRNLKGSFRLRRRTDVAGLRMLLIDDVMTTGSTLDECSKVLVDAGARNVKCLTLARGI